MSLESATFISSLSTSDPAASDQVKQGDDHIRLIKTVLQGTFPNADKAFYFPNALAKTANFSILVSHQGNLITGDTTSAFQLTLPSLASTDDGWSCVIQKITSDTNALTVAPASGTINGQSTLTLTAQWDWYILIWTGTTWVALNYAMALTKLAIVGATALTAPAIDDSLPIYDLSATANKKIALSDLFKTIPLLTSEGTLAVDDTLPVYDLSETAANSVNIQDLFEILNVFTEDTSPDPANDFLLSYDASASTVKKVKPKNIAAMQLLTTGTLSGASLQLVLTSYTAYRTIVVELTDALPASNAVDFQLLTSTDGGSNYDNSSSNYDYQAEFISRNGSATLSGNVNTTQILMLGGSFQSNSANKGACLTIKLWNRTAATHSKITWDGCIDDVGFWGRVIGTGIRLAAADVDAIKISPTSGNWSSGSYAVYGLQ